MSESLFGRTRAGEVWHLAKEEDGGYRAVCHADYRLKTTSTVFPEKMMCSECLRAYRGGRLSKLRAADKREERRQMKEHWPKKWLPGDES
jgi:hypothetical protein